MSGTTSSLNFTSGGTFTDVIETASERRRRLDRERKRRKRAERNSDPKPTGQTTFREERPADPVRPPAAEPTKARTLADEAEELGRAYGADDEPASTNGAPAEAAKGITVEGVRGLITGYVLLAVMDALMPEVVTFFYKRSRPDLKAKDLRLDKAQKEALIPIADAAADKLLGRLDPVALFLVASFAMYKQNVPDK